MIYQTIAHTHTNMTIAAFRRGAKTLSSGQAEHPEETIAQPGGQIPQTCAQNSNVKFAGIVFESRAQN